jgi:hypothetical protein
MTGTEIYKRSPGYERESRTIRLHAPEWKLLLAFDGERGLTDVALGAEIPFAEGLTLTQKFLDRAWIEEQPITLDQYLKRAGAPNIPTPRAAVPPATRREAAAEGPLSSASTPAPPPLPAESSAVKPGESSTESAKASGPSARSPMKLGAVVDYITSLVGNISLGQLLVYRVFLRVPPELLIAEEIASVHLVNDTSLIKGEKLQKAIADAVNAVAKRSLPDSVFAPA